MLVTRPASLDLGTTRFSTCIVCSRALLCAPSALDNGAAMHGAAAVRQNQVRASVAILCCSARGRLCCPAMAAMADLIDSSELAGRSSRPGQPQYCEVNPVVTSPAVAGVCCPSATAHTIEDEHLAPNKLLTPVCLRSSPAGRAE